MNDGTRLYTQAAAARECGQCYQLLRYYVMVHGLERPTERIGRRWYYTEEAVQRLKEFFGRKPITHRRAS
jgi:hypothetical protein